MTMIPYTDTHCHLDFERFDEDREQVLKRAWKAGLVKIINPAVDLPTGQAAIALAKQYPGKVYAAIGIHPNIGEPWTANILPTLRDQAVQSGVVAIGEIGLDYYRQHTPYDQQRMMLKEQLKLAEELKLPVIIHDREASHDLMKTLTEWHAGLVRNGNPLKDRPGVLHSFSADLETGLAAIDLNFCLGITGPVTFTNAVERKAIVRNLPLDHLLLETDSPYLTPHPHRGQRNEPAYIPLIAEEIARLHNTSPKEVADITYANATRLFQWK